ncbi:hypothetical protein KUCAC02_024828 [Chaenocephalus aceratus]|nr:hypothetical protein KUCAC02_024828 [Chaenocephalus aceratus]
MKTSIRRTCSSGIEVNVFSRQLNLIDYGDQYTANKLGSKKERTLALIKPDVVTKLGDVLESIYSSNLIVTKAKMTSLTWRQAADFYAEHQSKPFFNNLVQFVSSGPVVAMELMGDEAMSIWRRILGPGDSAVARKEAPESVRAKLGTDGVKNVGHGSDSIAAAARELEFFFPSTIGHGPSNTAIFTDCTCCIIKPHAITAEQPSNPVNSVLCACFSSVQRISHFTGLTGKILNSISAAGFQISALQMFNLDRANAEEFYEVYKGVVTEYASMVTELCSGPCMVLEIHGENTPKTFRDFCGPADPEINEHSQQRHREKTCRTEVTEGVCNTVLRRTKEISRHLRPDSVRALHGKDKVKNVVHCTDLPEDGPLEVEYFFKILDR